jgi:hypothetical protein
MADLLRGGRGTSPFIPAITRKSKKSGPKDEPPLPSRSGRATEIFEGLSDKYSGSVMFCLISSDSFKEAQTQHDRLIRPSQSLVDLFEAEFTRVRLLELGVRTVVLLHEPVRYRSAHWYFAMDRTVHGRIMASPEKPILSVFTEDGIGMEKCPIVFAFPQLIPSSS